MQKSASDISWLFDECLTETEAITKSCKINEQPDIYKNLLASTHAREGNKF